MNAKFIIGLALSFVVGAACSLFGIPSPAPPVLVGALVVLAMTVGYELADRFIAKRAAATREIFGGPSGTTKGAQP